MSQVLVVAGLSLAAGIATAKFPAEACAAAAHHELDFWLGEWSVVDQTTGKPAGTSHVESLYGGCVLRENWASQGFRGGSLNIFSKADGRWHQTWMDSGGAFRHFIGGLDRAGRMVLTARQPHPSGDGRTRLIRLTYRSNKDGTVRQYSDYSDDDGARWQLRYDFLYQPLGR